MLQVNLTTKCHFEDINFTTIGNKLKGTCHNYKTYDTFDYSGHEPH